jgi:hypothetical protein
VWLNLGLQCVAKDETQLKYIVEERIEESIEERRKERRERTITTNEEKLEMEMEEIIRDSRGFLLV